MMLVALAGTPGAFRPGSVLHLWVPGGHTLCDSAAFKAAARSRWRVGRVYEFPGVMDPRPLCADCRRHLDRANYLSTTHHRITKETQP